MALDPRLLDSLPDTLVEMYSLVEIDILQDMARRISTYDFFIPAAQHQNQKLQELGMVQSEIIEKLSALTGKTQAEIVELLTVASEQAIADDIEYLTEAEVYEPSQVNTEALHKQLNSGLLLTQLAFKNITRTTPSSGGIQFVEALDRAWTQINSGAFDYNTAISNAIKDLAEQGLAATNSRGKLVRGAIRYNRSGRVDTLEVAVRRALLTGANQTAAKTQEALLDELDLDLVETTAHGGARPEHAKWQGKVFSRNGRKVVDGIVYEDLKKATGYGSAGGLCGVNCRHNFHPYVHGAPKTYSKKQLEDYEAKKFEYNGKKYSEYEASQIQRKIEREIRKQKRTVAALEEVGQDASAERKKLKDAQKAYTDFTKQTGLKKQSARTRVATAKAAKKAAANEQKTPAPAPTNSKTLTKSTKSAISEIEKLENKRKEVKTIIESDETPKTINKGHQNKHIRDSKGYKQGKSYIFGGLEAAEALINEYSGTGDIKLTRKGEWTSKEFVEADKIIGVFVDEKTGEETETNRFSIHYGKNGTHIVPAKRRDEQQ